MEKRGVMWKNMVELIVLVLIIALIILIPSRLYANVSQEGSKSKEYFMILINNIYDKNGEPFVVFLEQGWLIKGYDKEDSPDSCDDEPCLCICKKAKWFWQKDDCENKGFCKVIEKNAKIRGKSGPVEIAKGFHDVYLGFNGIIEISEQELGSTYKKPETIAPNQFSVLHTGADPVEKAKQNVLIAMEHAKDNAVRNRKCSCGDSCEQYAEWLVQYSNEYGIPDPLLSLSLMMQESACKGYDQCNSAGYCGLMQIPKSTPNWNDPETNIKTGLSILKNKYNICKDGCTFKSCDRGHIKYNGWYAAIRGYNGWDNSACKWPEQDWFVEQVFNRYWDIGEYVQS